MEGYAETLEKPLEGGGANKFLDQVIGAQAGHLGGDVDGVVEVPQVINQTHLPGLAAGEDAAVGKLQDLFPCHTPSLGHHGYKLPEDVVYHGLENLSLFVGEGAGGGTHVFVGAAGEGFVGNADLVVEFFQVLELGDDADAPRQGAGVGHNAIGVGGNPVAAGGGGVAHGGDHYFTGLPQFFNLFGNLLGGGGGTAGAVDADDYCLDLGVVFSLADLGHDGIGASGETAKQVAAAAAGGDGAADVDDPDGVLGAAAGGSMGSLAEIEHEDGK